MTFVFHNRTRSNNDSNAVNVGYDAKSNAIFYGLKDSNQYFRWDVAGSEVARMDGSGNMYLQTVILNGSDIGQAQSNWNYGSNTAAFASNNASNFLTFDNVGNVVAASNAQSNWVFASNTSFVASNTAYWGSNNSSNLLRLVTASNAYAASNAQSNWVFASNTSVVASNTAYWGSNNASNLLSLVTASNAYAASNAQSNWVFASNTAIVASNTAFWGSNNSSNLLRLVTASNAYAASNAQSNWVFASNTAVSASNVGFWGSNNASNLLSLATASNSYAASNAQSNWVFASNTAVVASNAAFWGSNNASNLLSLSTASNSYAASNAQSNWAFASNTSVVASNVGFWGSNNSSNLLSLATASNSYAASNAQSNWAFASNTSVVASNVGFWGSNNASNLLSLATASNSYAASNAQSNWAFASNTSVAASNVGFWGSNNASNLLSLATASNSYAASNAQSNWVFASNTSVAASNVGFWGSNNSSNLLTRTLASNAYAASNAQSNWVFASNTAVVASNVGFWGSNNSSNLLTLATASNAYATSNAQSNWVFASNTSVAASNVGFWGSNYASNLLSLATASNAYATSNAQSNWAFASNTSVVASNVGFWGSNNASNLLSLATASNSYAASNAQSNWVFASNTAVAASNVGFWGSNNSSNLLTRTLASNAYAASNGQSNWNYASNSASYSSNSLSNYFALTGGRVVSKGTTFATYYLQGSSNTHLFEMNDNANMTFFYGSNSNASFAVYEANASFSRSTFNRYGVITTGDLTLSSNYASNNGRLVCASIAVGTASPVSAVHFATGKVSVGEAATAGNTTRTFNVISSNATLRVQRTSTGDPAVELVNSNTYTWDVYANNTDNSFNIRDRGLGGAGNLRRIVVTSNGNIGIGNTAPNYLLDVSGDINAASNILQGGVAISTLFAQSIAASNWDFASNTALWTSNNLSNYITTTAANTVYAPSNYLSNLVFGGEAFSNLQVIGDARIQGNLLVNGSTTIINTNQSNTEQLIVTNDGTGPAMIVNQKGLQPVVDFQDDGTSVLYIADGGKIGINNSNPQYQLDVSGTVSAMTMHEGGNSLTSLYAASNAQSNWVFASNTSMAASNVGFWGSNNASNMLSLATANSSYAASNAQSNWMFASNTSMAASNVGFWGSNNASNLLSLATANSSYAASNAQSNWVFASNTSIVASNAAFWGSNNASNMLSLATANSSYAASNAQSNWVWTSNQVAMVNAKSYGATGNGVTDDSTALQAALNSSFGSVYLEPGTYICASRIDVPANKVLLGASKSNTIIKRKAGASNDVIVRVLSGANIRSITVDGNYSNIGTASNHCYGVLAYSNTNGVIQDIVVKDTYGIGVGINYSDRIALSNVDVYSTSKNQPGFWIANSKNVVVIDCLAASNALDGLLFSSAIGLRIQGCRFNSNGLSLPVGAGALGAAGIYCASSSSNVTISDTEASFNTEDGINIAANNVVVSSCYLHDNQLSGIVFRESSNVNIADNIIMNNGNNSTLLNPSVWGKSGICLDGVVQANVVGNIVEDNRITKTQKYGVEELTNASSSNVVCIGNQMSNNLLGQVYGSGVTIYNKDTILTKADALGLYAASNGQSNWNYGSNTSVAASNTAFWGSNNASNLLSVATANSLYAASNAQSNWVFASNTSAAASNVGFWASNNASNLLSLATANSAYAASNAQSNWVFASNASVAASNAAFWGSNNSSNLLSLATASNAYAAANSQSNWVFASNTAVVASNVAFWGSNNSSNLLSLATASNAYAASNAQSNWVFASNNSVAASNVAFWGSNNASNLLSLASASNAYATSNGQSNWNYGSNTGVAASNVAFWGSNNASNLLSLASACNAYAASNAQSNWVFASNTAVWNSNNKLSLSGGSMTGSLVFSSNLVVRVGDVRVVDEFNNNGSDRWWKAATFSNINGPNITFMGADMSRVDQDCYYPFIRYRTKSTNAFQPSFQFSRIGGAQGHVNVYTNTATTNIEVWVKLQSYTSFKGVVAIYTPSLIFEDLQPTRNATWVTTVPEVSNASLTLSYSTASNVPIQYTSISDNVGFGTTSPAYKLDVNGSINASSNVYASNIGIGTTAPISALHVAGRVSIGDSLVAQSNTAVRSLNLISSDAVSRIFRTGAGDPAIELWTSNLYKWDFYVATGDGSFNIRDRTSVDTRRLVINSNGNVGIVTTSPSYALDVAGDINASNLRQGTSLISTLYAASNAQSNWNFASNTSFWSSNNASNYLPLSGGNVTGVFKLVGTTYATLYLSNTINSNQHTFQLNSSANITFFYANNNDAQFGVLEAATGYQRTLFTRYGTISTGDITLNSNTSNSGRLTCISVTENGTSLIAKYALSNNSSNWNYASNTAAWASNTAGAGSGSGSAWTSNTLSNYLLLSEASNAYAASNGQSNWVFASNTSAAASNVGFWGSNNASNLLSLAIASNAYAASNAQSNWVFASNTSVAASNMAFWGSNNASNLLSSATASNAYAASNGQSNWVFASNTSVAASNVGFWGSNNASNLLSVATANNAYAASNAQSNWVFASNTSAAASNVGFWGSNNASNLLSLATASNAYAASNGQSNWVFASNTSVAASNVGFWGSNNTSNLLSVATASNAYAASNAQSNWVFASNTSVAASNVGFWGSNNASNLLSLATASNAYAASNAQSNWVFASNTSVAASNVAFWGSNNASNLLTRALASNAYAASNGQSNWNWASNQIQSGPVGYWSWSGSTVYTNSNVGIATAGPQSQLHVSSSGSNVAGIIIVSNSNNSNFLGLFSGRSADSNPSVVYGSNVSLRFGSWTTIAGAGYSETMRINSNGNVGIGTQTPTFKLDITGSLRTSSNIVAWGSNYPISFTLSNSNVTADIGLASAAGGYSSSAVSNDVIIRSGSNTNLILQSGPGAGAVYIRSNNNVGIGTKSPIEKLQVVGGDTGIYAGTSNADAGGSLLFGVETYSNYGEMASIKGVMNSVDTTSANIAGGLAFYTRSNNATSNTTPVEAMRITHEGCVVIAGTTANSPNDKLTVNGAMVLSGRAYLFGGVSASTFDTGNEMWCRTSGYGIGVVVGGLSTDMIGVQMSNMYTRINTDFRYFYRGVHSDTWGDPGAGGSTLLTIKGATGNVAIGSFSNPQDRLHILGDLRVYNGTNVADQGGAIKFGTSNNPTFGEMSTIEGVYYSSNATNFAGGIAFYTRSNNATSNTSLLERMRITHDGRVGIGVTPTAYQLQLSLDSAAKPTTSAWATTSDIRAKDDIVLANKGICYSNVKNIPLKYFRWREDIYTDEQAPDRHKLGWIAQDVETTFPKAVDRINMHGFDDLRTLNIDQIIASMYGAVQFVQDIQEQQTANEQKQSKLSTLTLTTTSQKELVHSVVSAPRCDVVYRGVAILNNGQAIVNLDLQSVADNTCAMTIGIFDETYRNPQCFLQNDSSFNRLRGSISGGSLTIFCEDQSSSDAINWMVVAERKDPYVLAGADGRTNALGYLKPEVIIE